MRRYLHKFIPKYVTFCGLSTEVPTSSVIITMIIKLSSSKTFLFFNVYPEIY